MRIKNKWRAKFEKDAEEEKRDQLSLKEKQKSLKK